MEQLVAGVLDDGKREHWVEGDVAVGVELVADPVEPDAVDGVDAGRMGQLVFQLVDEGGVDAVHEAPVEPVGNQGGG